MLKTIWVKARDWWQQSFVRVFPKELLVRSVRNANTGGLLFLALLALLYGSIIRLSLMNPVFRLEDMAKQEGLIVEARFNGRATCGHTVVLKMGNENVTYKGYFSYDNLEILRSKIGEPITVWSHPKYTPCGKVSDIKRIQYKNDILEEYNYEQQIKLMESLHSEFRLKVCWIIIIASLMYIWFSYPSQSKFDKNKGDK